MALTEVEQLYLCTGVLSAGWLLLAVFLAVLWKRHCRLTSLVEIMTQSGRFKIQRAKMRVDGEYSYANPTITPDEELAKRGYSMYIGSDRDNDSTAHSQNPISGPYFVEDQIRMSTNKNQRQDPFFIEDQFRVPTHKSSGGRSNESPPPFMRSKSMEENAKLRNALASNGGNQGRSHKKRQPDNNNFIY